MRIIIVAIILAQLVTGAVDLKSVKHASSVMIIPHAYIVTLITGTHLKRGFSSPHAELYHELDIRATSYQVTKEWNNTVLLTGAVVKLGSNVDLVKLAQVNNVESITPIRLYASPKPVFKYVVEASNTTTRNDTLTTHVITGVDKLHAEGYFGKGIKVGIIDTGVDYTHPALGGKFGPGNKIIGGYDFVGDAYTALSNSSDPQPDQDPLDQCDGHGTHVAGIIGASPNNPYNISGVAYEASINAYRIFGCTGFTSDDIIIDALVRAYKDGNDVINLSLGGASGWTESVSGVVASRIADRGRVVVVSEGNDGAFGSWYASSPATGTSVISVGSTDNTVFNAQNATVSNGRQITYGSPVPLPVPAGIPLYATSSDISATADACNPLPATTPDLENYLVLIRRGNCSFVQKLDNASKFGAQYFLIYNNLDGPLFGIDAGNYTATLISQTDGEYLVTEGIPQNLTLSFPNNPFAFHVPGGGLISNYSTYGPTNDMYLKPSIVAPGGNILSTFPIPLGRYAVLSGTSFVAPFVAGSAALLLQARGKTVANAKAVRAVFQNTAMPIRQYATNASLFETASHQGAGLIQVYKAIHDMSSMLPAEILLNDTAHFNAVHTIKIKNSSRRNVTYTLHHVPAGTAPTIGGIENIFGPVPLVSNYAAVMFSPSIISIPAGKTRTIIAIFMPPTGLDPMSFPIYSGWIKADGSDGSSLQSTYLGVAGKLKNAKVLDNTDAYFGVKLPLVTDKDGNPISGPTTYTMNDTDTPSIIYRFVFGTPRLRIDLIDARQNVTTNQRRSPEPLSEPEAHSLEQPASIVNKRSTWSWLFSWRDPGSGTFAAVKTLGVIYREDYASRNSAGDATDLNEYYEIIVAEFLDGTAIPDGSYRILLRALKITGDPKKETDYEVWTSPEIIVSRT